MENVMLGIYITFHSKTVVGPPHPFGGEDVFLV